MKFGLVLILACAIISVAVAAPKDKKHKKHGGGNKRTAESTQPEVNGEKIKEFIHHVCEKIGSAPPAESQAARRRRDACECPPPAEAEGTENQEAQGDDSGKDAAKKHKKHKKHHKG